MIQAPVKVAFHTFAEVAGGCNCIQYHLPHERCSKSPRNDNDICAATDVQKSLRKRHIAHLHTGLLSMPDLMTHDCLRCCTSVHMYVLGRSTDCRFCLRIGSR